LVSLGNTEAMTKNQKNTDENASKGTLLEKFFVDSLKDIYWAEKHLTKALAKLAKESTSDELRTALEDHLAVTEEQVTKLDRVFETLGKKAQAKKCEAMEGLIKEGETVVDETEDDTYTRDVGIIIAAQKVEHYEIATYGGLIQVAKNLGNQEAMEILEEILAEEKEADVQLTKIAESFVNVEASDE
jgi:ferritin-like metal-binding protein YciE